MHADIYLDNNSAKLKLSFLISTTVSEAAVVMQLWFYLGSVGDWLELHNCLFTRFVVANSV